MSRSKSKSRNKKCYECGKTRHFMKDYFNKKNKQKHKMIDEENVVKLADSNTVDVYLVIEPLTCLNSANYDDNKD